MVTNQCGKGGQLTGHLKGQLRAPRPLHVNVYPPWGTPGFGRLFFILIQLELFVNKQFE